MQFSFENHLVKMILIKSRPQAPLGSGFCTDPPWKWPKCSEGGDLYRIILILLSLPVQRDRRNLAEFHFAYPQKYRRNSNLFISKKCLLLARSSQLGNLVSKKNAVQWKCKIVYPISLKTSICFGFMFIIIVWASLCCSWRSISVLNILHTVAST